LGVQGEFQEVVSGKSEGEGEGVGGLDGELAAAGEDVGDVGLTEGGAFGEVIGGELPGFDLAVDFGEEGG
jgi:hypothetical protein